MEKDYIFTHDLMFVVSDVEVNYRAPARLDDELVATAQIERLRGAALVFRQSVRRGAQVLAEGVITVACVDRDGVRPRRLPRDMVERLAAEQKA